MSNVTSPIILDETGQAIVDAITQSGLVQDKITQINNAGDAKIQEIIETVVVDPTLSIEGAAADAKATGEAVNELKSALDMIADNKRSLPGEFVRGTISTAGNLGDGQYRLRTTECQIFEAEETYVIDSGFQVLLYYYSSGVSPSSETKTGNSGWKTGTITIPANTYFVPLIGAVPEDTSVSADLTWQFKVYKNVDPLAAYKVEDGESWEVA